MNQFLDLMDETPELGPGQFDFSNPDRLFPAAVAQSPFRLWELGDPIPRRGVFILLGVATWSGYDMQLLDMLEAAMARPGDHPTVAVFNAGNLTSMDAVRAYVPDCPELFHTPAVGIWHDGVLAERAEGYDARDRVARLFGFTAKDVAEALDRARAARAE